MKGDTVGSTNLHLACNDRLLVGAVHADLEINEFSTRKGVTVKKLQVIYRKQNKITGKLQKTKKITGNLQKTEKKIQVTYGRQKQIAGES